MGKLREVDGVKMSDDLGRELVERYPALDLEEDKLLLEWLSQKHRKTLQAQGTRATAEIVARYDVGKYLDYKAIFLRELSTHGLDLGRDADRQFALERWREYGYPILTDEQGIPNAAEEAKKQIDSYLCGKASSSVPINGEAFAARFHERNVEAPVKLDNKQREFVRAYSEFISKAIQLDYSILKFRSDVLGNPQRTISHEEATKLVRSPAAQRLPLDFFIESSTPVIGHIARHMPTEGAPHNLYIEPPALFVDVSESRVRPMPFRWIATNGVLGKHPVADSSVLGTLQDLVRYLAKHHPITEELAAYLVLCGDTVQVAPLSVRVNDTVDAKLGAYTYDHSTITLTVPSWVRPEQVQQAYAKARAQVRAKNSYRSRSDRNISIFRFVIDRADPILPKDLISGTRGAFKFPPWKTMVGEWNKQLPKGDRWRFDQPGYTAHKMFRNAFADGYKAITGKEYHRQKPLTTKEEIQRELDGFKERLAKSLESYVEEYGNQRPEEEG
jgi:hypothetical protein